MKYIKKLFNRFLNEESKNKIRNKCSRLFWQIDKIIVYREYLKAVKYILKKYVLHYQKQDYDYRYGGFLNAIKEEFIRCSVMHEKFEVRDKKMQECIDYTINNGTDVYCGSLNDVQIYSEEDVKYDKENGLIYGIYGGKRLYFSKATKDLKQAYQELNGLAAEQSEHSPHRYLTEEFNVGPDDIVFDVGCADGNFSLSVVDKAKEIYLFEIEEQWMKPLQLTFAPYKDKVHIIKKCVTKQSDNFSVSIDEFCEKNKIDRIGLLKMDVEGYEKSVLSGAERMLQEKRIDKIAVCTYHRLNDEQELGAMLSDYTKETAEGYMLGALLCDIWDIKPPYFTKGLMRARLTTK
ncbi:MAG: FkbM family methyltransferase [Lachnospiraceae bacterium]|nr:FkbM family methyltransferase [Lachnospiraceae bacterium]